MHVVKKPDRTKKKHTKSIATNGVSQCFNKTASDAYKDNWNILFVCFGSEPYSGEIWNFVHGPLVALSNLGDVF